PFTTPVAAVRVGRIDGQWVMNPTFQQLQFSDLDIVVAGTETAITMVEGGAIEVPESEIAEALQVAHAGIKELIAIQREFLTDLSVPKMEWSAPEIPSDLRARVEEAAESRVSEA